MTEWHILEIKMPVGAFCAFLGFWHLVRYFTLFLGHAEIYTRLLEQARYKSQEEPKQSADDDESGPIVIPPDEYGDNPDYRSYSITYYEADGAFANEFDEPLDYNEWRNMLGSDILRHRGEYEEDRICVRNDKKRAYYELLLEEGECET